MQTNYIHKLVFNLCRHLCTCFYIRPWLPRSQKDKSGNWTWLPRHILIRVFPRVNLRNVDDCSVLHFFILVECILLRYLYMLYKHTTQKLYICDPQMQLNNFFTLPKISLHVLKISYSTAIHPSSLQVWVYLLLLNLYVYNAKEVFKIHNFLH
jgi:hypothetical protein